MEQIKSSTKIAGVDVGKHRLDVAVHGASDLTTVDNTAAGIEVLVDWLRVRGVGRVGLEASGGYERAARQALETAGFAVVVHQPLEVRLFARLKRLRAKNDRIDAQLIAAATAQVDAVRAAGDPRFAELAERMTAYEQAADLAAQVKHYLEHVTIADVAEEMTAQLATLKALKARLAAQLVARIKAEPDLAARFRLLLSLPGIGPIVAAALVVRMPELGRLRKGQASSLLGVAPFDRDSGQFKGQRFIAGGRSRPRRLIYIAALSAKRCDPNLKAFADRLLHAGKPAKLVITAVMRKLIEAANLVIAREQPWVRQLSS